MTPSFRSVLWRDLPLLNLSAYAIGIGHAEFSNLIPSRPELVLTALFPMLVPWGFFALRFRKADLPSRILAGGLSLGVPLLLCLNVSLGLRYPLDNETLRNIYEFCAILNTVVLMIHAHKTIPGSLALFLGPCLLYGLLLENGGIFLGYFSELNYHLYLGPLPAPIATVSGWVTIFYLVIWCGWELRVHFPSLAKWPLISAFLVTLVALCFDLQVDPLASAVGLWRWHPSLARAWLEVPTLNYVAWTAAVLPFSWLFFLREKSASLLPQEMIGRDHREWLLRRVPLSLGMASALFLGLMAILEGGTHGPTFMILLDALPFLSAVFGP